MPTAAWPCAGVTGILYRILRGVPTTPPVLPPWRTGKNQRLRSSGITGTCIPLSFPDTKAGGFLCEWNGSVVGVFHNTTSGTKKLDLSTVTDITFTQVDFISPDPESEASLDGNILTLDAQTSAVLR